MKPRIAYLITMTPTGRATCFLFRMRLHAKYRPATLSIITAAPARNEIAANWELKTCKATAPMIAVMK